MNWLTRREALKGLVGAGLAAVAISAVSLRGESSQLTAA